MFSLRKFNSLLSFFVILLGLYIMITPLLPQISFWLRDKSPEYAAPYGGELAKSEGSDSTLPPPLENRLVIPSIGINEPIEESNSISTINDGGTWRRPNTAIPTEDDNTVIVAHRYFGNEVSTFYHLDKIEIGQNLAIYWEGKEIIYQVTDKKIVDPTQVEIEAPTNERQLTLYTCTPIWTAKNRLVIIAKPLASQIED
jgi:LPXTG-site transpeptidase (sortase) family protein